MSSANDWKSAFYAAYVSSGQAVDSGLPSGGRLTYLQHIVAHHLPPDRAAHVIDLACGPGSLLYVLDQAGYRNVSGVDISAEQIAIAHRLGIVSATCAALEDFLAALPTASVDAVFAIDILEHLTRPQVMETLAAIRRVLKPGGRCICHVPNAEGIFPAAIRYGDFTHELAFTRVSASQIFRVAGFRQVLCFEDKPLVHGLRSLVRRIVWEAATLPSRLLHLAETGAPGAILSQNLLIEAIL